MCNEKRQLKKKALKKTVKTLNPNAAEFEPVARRTRSTVEKGNFIMMICALMASEGTCHLGY